MKIAGTGTGRRYIRAALLVLFTSGVLSSALSADIVAPVISIAGINSPSFTTEGARVICSVRVENTNSVALPLTGAKLRLKLADTPAARGRLLKNITIPANSIQNVDLLVDLTMSAAVTWLPMFMDNQAFSLPFEVRGYVDVDHADLGRVRFHETGDVAMTSDGLVVTPATPR